MTYYETIGYNYGVNESKESTSSSFEKQPQPDLRSLYSIEKIEIVPYVTLWEGEVSEIECYFNVSNNDTFKTSEEIEQVRTELIEFSTKGKTYSDDPKARLTYVDWHQGNKIWLGFSKVSYSDYIVTNNAME